MSIVFIVSAPSGSGKSTLVNELFKMVTGLDFSISYTTRPPRGSEQNGKEYFFVSEAEFKTMISADEFLEYAKVFGHDGDYYGTARRFLREAENRGHDLLLDIDVQGAAQIKTKLPEAVSIFILPPTARSWNGDCATGDSIRRGSFVAGWTRPVERLRITPNTTIY